MYTTKSDLSFDEAKVDFDALLATAKIAYWAKLNAVQGRTEKMMNMARNDDYNGALESEWLFDDVRQLRIVAETVHTLQESIKRSQFSIVNKPEVKP